MESNLRRAARHHRWKLDRPGKGLRRQLDHAPAEIESNTAEAYIPSSVVLDRLPLCEAHLSREFDLTLNQLEHLQQMRKGQLVSPPIRRAVSS